MEWTAVLWISYQNNTVLTCTSLSQDIFNFQRRLKTFISQENKIASFIPLNKKAILYVFENVLSLLEHYYYPLRERFPSSSKSGKIGSCIFG